MTPKPHPVGPPSIAKACAVWLAAASLANVGPVWAAPAAAPTPVVIGGRWLKGPTGADVAAVYPWRAQKSSLNGRAEVICDVAKTGQMERCRVFAEAPLGMGFGAAALKLAAMVRHAPVDQPPVGPPPIAFIPFHFEVEGGSGPNLAIIVDPVWASIPDAADVTAAFPKSATATAGGVILRCAVGADGSLGVCNVLKESPPEQGFAAAAVRLAGRFRVDLLGRPAFRDKLAVFLGIRFAAGPRAATPASMPADAEPQGRP